MLWYAVLCYGPMHSHVLMHCRSEYNQTHLLLLCSPCSLGMLGGICLLLPQGDSPGLVWLVLTDDSPPFCEVLDCLCPVSYVTKVVIEQVTPAQGCSTWRSFLSTWSASHKLSLGAKGWHPPNMSKPLQSSLSQLVLH